MATPIPLISEATWSTRATAPVTTTLIPPVPDQRPSLAPPEGRSESAPHTGTTVQDPGGRTIPGVVPSSTQSLPPAKVTLSTENPDNNIPQGYPTTAPTPYSPLIVTAGAIRNTVDYYQILGGLLGLHLMYYIAFACR